MKYVRHKEKGMVIFPNKHNEGWWHLHMAQLLGKGDIISAGFIIFREGKFVCEGYSKSLGLGPAPDDNEELKNLLKQGHYNEC
ncbi:hypothetical protein LCGC14_1013090 [marine sediment metagenome]|uniref:Uncharacterized protein n=1 Tax=marine sediment metagenome TaxID=412755 RepID=A0A0F9MZT0_9ZZZZ